MNKHKHELEAYNMLANDSNVLGTPVIKLRL